METTTKKNEAEDAISVFMVKIPVSALNEIPEDERIFFIQAAHAYNEICSLSKLMWWIKPEAPEIEEPEKHARTSQRYLIHKLVLAKSYEAYKLVKRFYSNKKAATSYLLNDRIKNLLRTLKKYFSKVNVIFMIRNEYAFHYSDRAILDAISRKRNDDELLFYIARDPLNCAFCGADDIMSSAMHEVIEPGNEEEAFIKFAEAYTEISAYVMAVLYSVVEVIIMHYVPLNGRIKKLFVRAYSRGELPYFTSLGSEITRNEKR